MTWDTNDVKVNLAHSFTKLRIRVREPVYGELMLLFHLGQVSEHVFAVVRGGTFAVMTKEQQAYLHWTKLMARRLIRCPISSRFSTSCLISSCRPSRRLSVYFGN